MQFRIIHQLSLSSFVKMRVISIVLFGCLIAYASSALTKKTFFDFDKDVKFTDFDKDVKFADTDFLIKQKAILEVLQHVHQPEIHTKMWDDAKTFMIEENFDLYTNVDAVKNFLMFYKNGLLKKEKIFTFTNKYHKDQVVALFHLFYYAKDWDSFYKTMVWARFHVNEGMFVYALTVAVLHRKDMVGIILPAPYEIYPYYFFDDTVISKAQRMKMQGLYGSKMIDGVKTATFTTDYFDYDITMNTDTKVAYFTEDIGLNSYYFYFHADYPFWMGGTEFGLYKDRRGEMYLYQHQQLLARYYMERLSNDLGKVKVFDWDKVIKTGYSPKLRFYNGMQFPTRDNFYTLDTTTDFMMIETVKDFERRIRDTIDLGYMVLPDGTKIDMTKPTAIEYLGNLIQTNMDSKNTKFYGYMELMTKLLIGGSLETTDMTITIPSVLEKYETAMRDPLFYQMYKRMISFYYKFLDRMPMYTKDDLDFTGITIDDVMVDKLVTFFDRFEADITNAVDVDISYGMMDKMSIDRMFMENARMSKDKTHMDKMDKDKKFDKFDLDKMRMDKEKMYDTKYDDKYDSKYDTKYDSKYDTKYDSKYDTKYDHKYDTKYDTEYDSRYGMDKHMNMGRGYGYDKNYFYKDTMDKTYFDDKIYMDDKMGRTYMDDDYYKKMMTGTYFTDTVIKVVKPRLNHAKFTTKLTITSDKVTKAVVHMFVAPKYDEFGKLITITKNRKNFFKLDKFVVDLTIGKNMITRSSDDFSFFVKDRTTYVDLYRMVMKSLTTKDYKFPLDMSETHCGFPNRLMLPKGKLGGMPFTFFYMITKYVPATTVQFTGFDETISCGVGSGARYIDDLPFGYPFDRKIETIGMFKTRNMFFYDTIIYHKDVMDIKTIRY